MWRYAKDKFVLTNFTGQKKAEFIKFFSIIITENQSQYVARRHLKCDACIFMKLHLTRIIFTHFAGPVHWGMINAQCDGKKQSPIDIKEKEALVNNALTKIELDASWNTADSGSSKSFKLKNKGYTVQLDIGKYKKIQTTQSGKS